MFEKDYCYWQFAEDQDSEPTIAAILRQFFTWIDEGGEMMNENGDMIDFRGYTPLALVQWCKKNPGRFEVTDLISKWLNANKYLRKGTMRTYRSRVVNFFEYNRVQLPKDKKFKIRSNTPAVVGTLTFEEVRMMLIKCNLLYRAVFLAMLMGGMGEAEVIYWSNNGWHETMNQIYSGARHIRVQLPGRKKGKNDKPFYTWLGYDAVTALKKYLEKRGMVPGPIFITQFDTGISRSTVYAYWLRKLYGLGLVNKPKENRHGAFRTGKNPHEIRDVFRTRWEKSPAKAVVAEFMMGHYDQVDPNEYNKAYRDADWTLQEYIQAEPWLNAITQDPTKMAAVEVDKYKLETQSVLHEMTQAMITMRMEIDKLNSRLKTH